jgi:hypothetical protein
LIAGLGMKRWIIFLHRYLGIPMSVVFVVWFLSGIVMMYTGDMPALSAPDRLRGLDAIDLQAIRLSPDEAAARAGLDGAVTEATVQTLLGRPAYRFAGVFGPRATVFADSGEIFESATNVEARAEVARFLGRPLEAVRYVETLSEADQWTLTEARSLPLERFDVDDGRGTRAYFSQRTGEVELVTNGRSRLLAWAGAIPHWFYFTPLRLNQPVWYWTVVWVSVVGCALAVLGLVLAFTQFRRSRPFRLSASIRYRGWMRWHYLTGAVFGVFALTWVFSGLLSMEPFDWTRAEGLYLPANDLVGGELELDRYRLGDPAFGAALGGVTPVEIDLMRIQKHPYYMLETGGADGPLSRRLVDAETLKAHTAPFSVESILTELAATVTEAPISEYAELDDYDAYYYAQDGEAPLPVLRVKFDDPARTWYYFDLMTSGPVAANHRSSRLERWLFNGLHSLDFPFWYRRRPLWDSVIILLSIGALTTSVIGMFLGWRRLLGRSRPAKIVGESS